VETNLKHRNDRKPQQDTGKNKRRVQTESLHFWEAVLHIGGQDGVVVIVTLYELNGPRF
jgi:hypothetical protein